MSTCTVYRISCESTDDGEHLGYVYCTSKKDLEETCKRYDTNPFMSYEVKAIRFTWSLPGIAELLNQCGGHPDNG